jgi:rhamnose transport system permease protein
MLRNLAAGRAVCATGSNVEAARLAGIPTLQVKLWVFAILGALTGVAAVWNAVRFQQIPSNTGLGLELKVIAAVAVGGTSVRGGSGRVFGTVLGVILLGLIAPVLAFYGLNAYWEKAVHGMIVLAAVASSAQPSPRHTALSGAVDA